MKIKTGVGPSWSKNNQILYMNRPKQLFTGSSSNQQPAWDPELLPGGRCRAAAERAGVVDDGVEAL
jgi:hypothetical protein